DEHVPVRKQADEQAINHVLLSDHHPVDFGAEMGKETGVFFHAPTDGVDGRCHATSSLLQSAKTAVRPRWQASAKSTRSNSLEYTPPIQPPIPRGYQGG